MGGNRPGGHRESRNPIEVGHAKSFDMLLRSISGPGPQQPPELTMKYALVGDMKMYQVAGTLCFASITQRLQLAVLEVVLGKSNYTKPSYDGMLFL